VWPKKLKVGNAHWLHKAALVTHKNLIFSVCL